MDTQIKLQVENIIKSVMDVDITKINPDTKFSSIKEWDSFNNLMLISKFQDEFNIEFTAVEIEETQKVKDLFSLIERKVKK